MPTIKVRDSQGNEGREIQLSSTLFEQQANIPMLHQVAVSYAANQRQGTHATRGFAEVRGGGRKPFRQKGTGRARQGSIRAPHMRGGATQFGPKPRSYRRQLNKRMRQAAIRQAFSDLCAANRIVVMEDHGIAEPKTRNAAALLKRLGVYGQRVLVVTDGVDLVLHRAMRNLATARVLPVNEIHFQVLVGLDALVLTSAALAKIESTWGTVE